MEKGLQESLASGSSPVLGRTPRKNPGNIRGTGIRFEDARSRLDGRQAGSPFLGLLPALMQQSRGGGYQLLVTPALLIPHPSAPPLPPSLSRGTVSLRVVCTRSFSFSL